MTKTGERWFAFCRSITYLLMFRFSGGITAIGKENIPDTGPLLVAPIHVSHLDSMAVACGMRRPIQPMAKEELFKGIFGVLIRSLGAFPVRRGENDTEAIRAAMAIVERGEVVLLFPEGTRGDGETLLPMNRGVAMIAKRTDVLVMPIGVIGTNVRWPKGQKLPKKGKVVVAYGKPFRYGDVATGASERENREIFSAVLAERISELCAANGYPIKIDPSNLRSQSMSGPG